MTHFSAVGLGFVAVTTVLYLALGVWVLRLRPHRHRTTALGVLVGLIGLTRVTALLPEVLGLVPFHENTLLERIIEFPFAVGVWGAAVGLAYVVPEPLEDRGLLGAALAGGFALSLLDTVPLAWRVSGTGWLVEWFVSARSFLAVGFLLAALLLLAFRARPARDPKPGEVIQLALLTVAIALLDAAGSGSHLVSLAEELATGQLVGALGSMADVAQFLVVAGVWGWNMVRADRDTVRIHRAVMLGILGLLAVGAIATAFGFGSGLIVGSLDVVGVGLLVYGVLRHDLAGLDAKFRWGVSKTTVAGIFVAVFFIVSEGAQALFADFAGNEFLGVLAAGALVFAISPLQRLADRFAAKAVPGGAEAGVNAEERYREALQLALADGEISPEEENRLADLAERLDIGHRRSLELRREVEDEATGGDRP